MQVIIHIQNINVKTTWTLYNGIEEGVLEKWNLKDKTEYVECLRKRYYDFQITRNENEKIVVFFLGT